MINVLKHPEVHSQMFGHGSNIQNLNQEMLAAVLVPVPPLELQEEFVAYVAEANREQLELQKQLESVGVRRDHLLDQYLAH